MNISRLITWGRKLFGVLPKKDSYCSYCGSSFGNVSNWPRKCRGCSLTTWKNPLPVGVLLIPVDSGLLLVRRSIAPKLGELALPGGFIEAGESWQVGAAREAREEAQINLSPEEISLFDVHSTPDGNSILIFGISKTLQAKDLSPFVPTKETSERIIAIDETDVNNLAFSLHTQTAKRFFETQRTYTISYEKNGFVETSKAPRPKRLPRKGDVYEFVHSAQTPRGVYSPGDKLEILGRTTESPHGLTSSLGNIKAKCKHADSSVWTNIEWAIAEKKLRLIENALLV